MGTSCGRSDDPDHTNDNLTSLGLVLNHAYSVLDVREVDGHRYERLIIITPRYLSTRSHSEPSLPNLR